LSEHYSEIDALNSVSQDWLSNLH